jgi:hypothetical protein
VIEIFGNPDALSALGMFRDDALFEDDGIGDKGWHGRVRDAEDGRCCPTS